MIRTNLLNSRESRASEDRWEEERREIERWERLTVAERAAEDTARREALRRKSAA